MSGDAPTIGINGFGRIGRSLLRAALNNPLVRVTAINDPYINAEYAAYLLASDCQGALKVEAKDDAIVVNGAYIEVTQRSDPSSIPWKVTYVVDCSGVFTTQERAGQHLASGASRVFVASTSADILTFVMGVNETKFTSGTQVLSCGSPTGVVLSIVLRLLSEVAPIEFASFTAIHAATSQQKVVDGINAKDWASARASSNIIPFATGAHRTVQRTLPSLSNIVVGTSYHVPTGKGCVLDITLRAGAPLSKSQIENALCAGGLIDKSAHSLVSGDVAGRIQTGTPLALLDDKSIQMLGDRLIKLSLWYDNEVSFVKSIISLILSTNKTW